MKIRFLTIACILLTALCAFGQAPTVQYDKDGVTLFYVDAAGKKVAHYVFEGDAYGKMLETRDAQLQAVRENLIAKQNYEQAVDNAQASVDAGRTVTAPTKPLMKLVGNTGEVTFVPFDPPLKDLVPAAPTRPAPSSGQIKVDTPDKQAIMFNMILAIFRKLFPDAQ